MIYVNSGLLGCYSVSTGKYLLAFRNNVIRSPLTSIILDFLELLVPEGVTVHRGADKSLARPTSWCHST